MKRITIAILFCMICCVAVVSAQAQKPAGEQLSEKGKAAATVKAFLENMDTGKYEAAFAYMDFDALILDQTKKDPSKLTAEQKASQIKAYKNLAKNMFLSEKKQTKFRNFSIGTFVRTGDKATLSIINTPPKGTPGSPVEKIFKLVQVKGEWKIYGNTMPASK